MVGTFEEAMKERDKTQDSVEEVNEEVNAEVNAEVNEETEDETSETMYGTCRFCKQIKCIDPNEYMEYTKNRQCTDVYVDAQQVKDWIATMHCTCEDAKAVQHQEDVKKITIANIKELFEKDHAGAAELMIDATELMVNGAMTKLTIQVTSKTKATMVKTSKGDIKVSRTISNTDTLES